MDRIYLETNALRKITTYSKEDNVYTSVFALFELISGINSKIEFDRRKAAVTRVIKKGIYIDWDYVDKKLCNFWGDDRYDKIFSYTFKQLLNWLLKDDYYEIFKMRTVLLRTNRGILIEKNALEWL